MSYFMYVDMLLLRRDRREGSKGCLPYFRIFYWASKLLSEVISA